MLTRLQMAKKKGGAANAGPTSVDGQSLRGFTKVGGYRCVCCVLCLCV